MKLLPTIGAAGLALPYVNLSKVDGAPQQPNQRPQQPMRISKESMHEAEKLIGIELTSEQEDMALPGVNQNLNSYETLRKLPIPLDTEPATSFHPALPGKKFKKAHTATAAAKTGPARIEVPHYSRLEDVAFFSAAQLGELIRTRKVSSIDLTKMYIARLKHYGPKLNCVVTMTEDLAMKQAEQADKDLRNGKYHSPLHGIPWGAKDLFATKGILTTWGAEPFKNQVPDYDATVVERLHQGGAVLVAKLSLGALAQGSFWMGKDTHNPWNTERSSSGSSAGPASATSAGLVGFSIGTETLGSIVSPSSTCGVAGLRPTYGRISRYGAMALSWTMDKIGPICRSVEDCAIALKVAYGPDGKDFSVGDVPFDWPNHTPLSKLRIGYLKSEFEPQQNNNPQRQLSEQQRQAMEQRLAIYKAALDDLKKAGADLQPISLPDFPAGALRIILEAEAATAFDDITRDGEVNQLSAQGRGDWPNSFRTSRFIPAVEYIRAMRGRTLLMQQMDKLMSQWDVFVSPAPGSASLTITNLTGHPQVCVPCGFVNNLPLAIMFTGNVYDEGSPLAAALAYEKATKWHTMHPKVDWEASA
ncbi:MAG TPA: amidase [Blastocatellia bacterium]|nr:amidase [Blastocatellia bacterium]